MKVNYENSKKYTYLRDLNVGATFLAKRSVSQEELALYMVVDKHSGIFSQRYSDCRSILAVNISTGQIRAFSYDAIIDPVNAEVVFR